MTGQKDSAPPTRIAVVGAGLAGTMIAVLLGRLGTYEVKIFEKRDDPRVDAAADNDNEAEFGRSANAAKRSINLALSERGQAALAEIGLLDEVMKDAIRMPCRVIHELGAQRSGDSVLKQAYGTADQAIWSVSREGINLKMLNQSTNESDRVSVVFNHSLVSLHAASGKCTFRDEKTNKEVTEQFDLVIGADGAYSSVRENMLRQGRIDYSRQYIDLGYKELCIPPKIGADGKPTFALDEPEGLHIWPRGAFMMIALPNPDFSFTATLFAPYRGDDGFDSVDPDDQTAVDAYFNKHFPDLVPLIPDLQAEFKNNPVGSLVTVKVSEWRKGKVLLLGDAAHAVVPFYGQGMNAAFEDGNILYRILRDLINSQHPADRSSVDVLLAGAESFAKSRRPAGDALAELCVEHYHDMASNTASSLYLFQKKVEEKLHYFFPSYFVPIYTLVAFTETPYHHITALQKKYGDIAGRVVGGLATIGAGMLSLGVWKLYKRSQ